MKKDDVEIAVENGKKKSLKIPLIITTFAALYVLLFISIGYVYDTSENIVRVKGYASERHDEAACFDVAIKDYFVRNDEKYRVVNENDSITLVSINSSFEATNLDTYTSSKYQITNHVLRGDEIVALNDNRILNEEVSVPYDVDDNCYFLYDKNANLAMNLNDLTIDGSTVPKNSLLELNSENKVLSVANVDNVTKEATSAQYAPESVITVGGNGVKLGSIFGFGDLDGDGLSDDYEVAIGTNPAKPDTDEEGIDDGDEIAMGTNPNNPDSDGDGISDAEDTHPIDSDHDNDGIIDGEDLDPEDPNVGGIEDPGGTDPGDIDEPDTDTDPIDPGTGGEGPIDPDIDDDGLDDNDDSHPLDPSLPAIAVKSLKVDSARYYPGEDVEVTIQLDNPSQLPVEEISINGVVYNAADFTVNGNLSTVTMTIPASMTPESQADVVTLDYVKYAKGTKSEKLTSGQTAKADILYEKPEFNSAVLDKVSYVVGETAAASITLENFNNAQIKSIKVDGKDYPATIVSNTNQTTEVTIQLPTPQTAGASKLFGAIEGFTYNNGVGNEYVALGTPVELKAKVVYVTPVLEGSVTLDKSTYNPGETVIATLTFTNENNAPISSVTVDGVEKPFTPTTAGDYSTGTIVLTTPQTAGSLATIGTIDGFTFDDGVDQAIYVDVTNVLIKANILAKTPILKGFELDKSVYEANSTVIVGLTFTNENNAPISSVTVNGTVETFATKSNVDGITTGTIELAAPTSVGVDQLIGTIEGFTFDNGVSQTEYVDITTDLQIAEDVVHEPVVVTNVGYDVGPYRTSGDVEVTVTFDNPTGATIETVVVGGTSEQVTGQVDDSATGTSTGKIMLTAPTTVGASQLIGEVTEVTYHDGINPGVSGTVSMTNPTVEVDVIHDPVVLTGVSYGDVPYTPGQDVEVELTFDNPTGATIENIGVDNGTSVSKVPLENQQNDSVNGTSTGLITLTAPSLIDADQLIGTVTEVTYHDGINSGVSGTVTAPSPAVTVDVIHEAVVLTGINYVPGPHMPSESVEVELTFSNPTGATIGNIGVNDGTTSVSMALENQQNNTDGTSTGTIYLTAPDFVVAGEQIGTVESFTYDHDNDIATAEIAGTLNVTDPNIVVNVTGEPISVVSVTIEDEDDDTDARFYPGEDILVTITLNNPDDLQIEKIKINGTVYNAGEFTVAPDVDDTTVVTKVITAAPQPIADYQVVLDSVTYDKYNNDAEMVEVTSGAAQVADVLYEIPSLSGTVTLDHSPYYPGDTATATLTFTNPNKAPITSVTVDGVARTFTPTVVGDNTTGTIQFTVPVNIGALKQIGNIEDFTFNNGVTEENVEIADVAILSDVVHTPVEVADVSYEDGPYYPLDEVVVTLVVSNPTGATIEQIEVTNAGTPTWYTFAPGTYDSANKTTTGTITLTAPGVGTGQTIGEVTGVKYHDGINPGALGTVGVTGTDAQVTLNVVHKPVVLTNVTYTEGPYTLGENVDITLTFDNPTEADIETVTVEGTPVFVKDQVDNGDGTSTGIITLTPTVVDLDQDLGTIEGFAYDDDDDLLTTGAVGTITATNLDIIADVVHVPPTLTDVTYTNRQYTIGEGVAVELTFNNPSGADIENVTVGGASLPFTETSTSSGVTTGTITLSTTVVGLAQTLGTIEGFTYDHDEDDLTTGIVGTITATNLGVVVDVIHVTPTLTDVSYVDTPYTLTENVVVTLTFDNTSGATINNVQFNGSVLPFSVTSTTNGVTTGTITVDLTEPGTNLLVGSVDGFTFDNDNNATTADVAGNLGTVPAADLDVKVDVVYTKLTPTLESVSVDKAATQYIITDTATVTAVFADTNDAPITGITVLDGDGITIPVTVDNTGDIQGDGKSTATFTMAVPDALGDGVEFGTISAFMFDNDGTGTAGTQPPTPGTTPTTNNLIEGNVNAIDTAVTTPSIASFSFDRGAYEQGQAVPAKVTLEIANTNGAPVTGVTIKDELGTEIIEGEFQSTNNVGPGESTTVTFTIPVPSTVGELQTFGFVAQFEYDNDGSGSEVPTAEVVTPQTELKANIGYTGVAPELTGASLNETYYFNDDVTTGEKATITATFNNPMDAPINELIVVDPAGIEIKLQVVSQTHDLPTDGVTTATFDVTIPDTKGLDQNFGTVTGFTFNNGISSDEIPGNQMQVEYPLAADVNVVRVADEATLAVLDDHPDKDESEVTFLLMNNIVLSGADFNPIDSFAATFDGQGYTISNYYSATNGLFASTTTTAVIDSVNISGKVDLSGSGDGVGILVGSNSGVVSNSSATGSINASSSNNTGGLVGTNTGTITNSYAGVDVNGYTHAGGLVGWNQATISNCYATGDVTTGTSASASTSGGLAGMNFTGGSINNSYATGDAEGFHHVGGLVGQNYDDINNSFATGDVIGFGVNIGGFVGYHGDGNVANSYATGNVEGSGATGFAGTVFGTITSSYSYQYQFVNGTAIKDNNALAGPGIGIATQAQVTSATSQQNLLGSSYSYQDGMYPKLLKSGDTVEVSGQTDVLIPLNAIEIRTASELQGIDGHAQSGDVNTEFILMNDIDVTGGGIGDFNPIDNFGATFNGGGHLIYNYNSTTNGLFKNTTGTSVIEDVNIRGTVVGSDTNFYGYGLLVGKNMGQVSNCTSEGSVTGLGVNSVGGLVGYNTGNATIEDSHSSATLSNTYCNNGGLVGWMDGGTITNSYATGSINGTAVQSGGLVGALTGGTVSNCYATGSVTGASELGGLVGLKYGAATITDCYATGDINGSGNNCGGLVGRNDGPVINSYATGKVTAGAYVGGLIGNMQSGSVSNSYATGDVSGIYYVGGLVGHMEPESSISNTYATGNVSASDYGAGGLVGRMNTGSVSNSFATGNVTASGTDPWSEGLAGGLVGAVAPGGTSSFTNSYAYELQTVNGALVKDNPANLASIGANGQFLTFDQLVSTGGQEVLGTTGFLYQAGNWPKVKSSQGEEIPGQTWITIEKVIEISNAIQLQGIEWHSTKADTTVTYRVTNSIDVAAGGVPDFDPIDYFGTTFDGQGYLITGYNSTTNGLFARTTNTSVIDDVHISGTVTASSTTSVGMLVGVNSGEVKNSSSSGSVSGAAVCGGLVGDNYGPISNCYSTATVNTVGNYAGGLVASNNSSVNYSYATGNVTGQVNVGGLAGACNGTILSCYATGTVTGTSYVGGLLGTYTGSTANGINCTFVTGNVNGDPSSTKAAIGNYGQFNPGGSVANNGATDVQKVNGATVDSNTKGADYIASYEQLVEPDSLWMKQYLGDNFTYYTGHYPQVVYPGTTTPLPGQVWVPIKTRGTTTLTTDDQTSNNKELSDDSNSVTDNEHATEEGTESTGQVEEVPATEEGTESTDQVEEVPATEELISVNPFEKRAFGMSDGFKSA